MKCKQLHPGFELTSPILFPTMVSVMLNMPPKWTWDQWQLNDSPYLKLQNWSLAFRCILVLGEYFNIRVSQKFCNILAAPDVFAEVMKMTNHTGLWDAELM